MSFEHKDNQRAPLIRGIKSYKNLNPDRYLRRCQFNNIWQKYVKQINLVGVTPYSARTTFISNAIENNCSIVDVQKTVKHANITTIQMYDRSNEKYDDSAAFTVRY